MLFAKARRTKPYISGSWNHASDLRGCAVGGWDATRITLRRTLARMGSGIHSVVQPNVQPARVWADNLGAGRRERDVLGRGFNARRRDRFVESRCYPVPARIEPARVWADNLGAGRRERDVLGRRFNA